MEKHARNVNSPTNEDRDRQRQTGQTVWVRAFYGTSDEKVARLPLRQFLLSQCDIIDGLRL